MFPQPPGRQHSVRATPDPLISTFETLSQRWLISLELIHHFVISLFRPFRGESSSFLIEWVRCEDEDASRGGEAIGSASAGNDDATDKRKLNTNFHMFVPIGTINSSAAIWDSYSVFPCFGCIIVNVIRLHALGSAVWANRMRVI